MKQAPGYKTSQVLMDVLAATETFLDNAEGAERINTCSKDLLDQNRPQSVYIHVPFSRPDVSIHVTANFSKNKSSKNYRLSNDKEKDKTGTMKKRR